LSKDYWDSKDHPQFNPCNPCSLFVTQIPDSRFLPFLQYLRNLINTLRVDIIQNLIQNHTELLIRTIRAIRGQVFMCEIISVIPFHFDYRLPPSRLGKAQACLVLLSLLCRFRFFRCEYNTTTDLPDQTDNYISCLRTIWTPRTIRTIRASVFMYLCVRLFPCFRYYSVSSVVGIKQFNELSSSILYVLLLLCLILSSFV